MNVHDAIKDLRAAAKRLDAATFNPDMNALAEFVNKLGDRDFDKPIENVRQQALEKFLRGSNDFTRRERRALPFIIYESAINVDDVRTIFGKLDFDNKRHISALVNVYLNQYDDSAKTELLRRRLIFVPKDTAGNSTRLKKIFAAREFLFGDNRFANTAKLFAERQSVAGVLDDLGLADSFKVSNFIHAALVTFYRMTDLAAQLKVLRELDADFDAYQNIFPAVADALIQAVARAGYGKELCLDVFYHRLGDPRFGDSRFKWHGVSAKSVEIFSHWLSANDLETFFEIIKQTAVNRMWRYREKFWRAYLPHIINTKIFLGSAAESLAAQVKDKVQLKHGELKSADATQSVFVFQIGKYIFSEWSHNGKLRVHHAEATTDFFTRGAIDRDDLVKKSIAEWIHSGSWQDRVSSWIAENC